MTFTECYNELAPRLTNYLIANGASYELACDLVQETFLRVWEKRDTLIDDPKALSGLVYAIARNLRIDAFRKNKAIIYEAELRDEAVETNTTSPSDLAYLRNRLRAAFAQLPPLLREAYTLFQISELSIREIAQITNVTESLVKVRIFRAKQRLQEILKDLK